MADQIDLPIAEGTKDTADAVPVGWLPTRDELIGELAEQGKAAPPPSAPAEIPILDAEDEQPDDEEEVSGDEEAEETDAPDEGEEEESEEPEEEEESEEEESEEEEEEEPEAHKPKKGSLMDRVNTLTRQKKEAEEAGGVLQSRITALESQLADATAPRLNPTADQPFADVRSVAELDSRVTELNQIIDYVRANPDGAVNGDKEYSSDELRRYGDDAIRKISMSQMRRDFLKQQEQSDQAAKHFYPEMFLPGHPAEERAKQAVLDNPGLLNQADYHLRIGREMIGKAVEDGIATLVLKESPNGSKKKRGKAKSRKKTAPKAPAPAGAGVGTGTPASTARNSKQVRKAEQLKAAALRATNGKDREELMAQYFEASGRF